MNLLTLTGYTFCAFLLMSLVMIITWLWQKKTGIAGIVDCVWAFGTGIIAAALSLTSEGPFERRAMIAAMSLIWGFRLGIYLQKRLKREKEDIRYTKAKEMWKENKQRYMFIFYQIQAVWTILFALPMFTSANSPAPFPIWTDFLAILIWLIAMIGETVADQQLKRYRQWHAASGKNEKPICDTGLWRYSRHPNYFFEWLHWFSYALIGTHGLLLTLRQDASFSIWGVYLIAILAPAVMLYFLLKVTGIPLTEKYMRESRGAAYELYAQQTSAFFPRPPRQSTGSSAAGMTS